MNMNHLQAQVNLIDSRVKMEACVPGKEPIIMDYFPPIGGGEGYTPLEVLLISLATCFSTTVKTMLVSHLKKEIRGMSVDIEGERLTEHPTRFETIKMDLNIESPNLKMEELEKVAAMAEKTYCPVWAMLEGNVKVETEFKIG